MIAEKHSDKKMTSPIIRCRQLTKTYDETRAVDGIDLDIARGSCVGLLGLNGAGKTTLLKMMSSLTTPTSGRLEIEGVEIAQAPETTRCNVGFLPETPPLYDEMTTAGFLKFIAQLRGVPVNRLNDAIRSVSERCEIAHVLDQTIGHLSYGYKKRVGIASAIVHEPTLVILDEPIAGLDPAQIVGIRDLVRTLKGDHTVIISSHILTEMSQVCDRIVVIHRGKVVATGTESELTALVERQISIDIQVRGDREPFAELLDGFSGLTTIHFELEADGICRAAILLESDNRAELSRAIVTAGLELVEFSRRSDQLETVFLDLTKSAKSSGAKSNGVRA